MGFNLLFSKARPASEGRLQANGHMRSILEVKDGGVYQAFASLPSPNAMAEVVKIHEQQQEPKTKKDLRRDLFKHLI